MPRLCTAWRCTATIASPLKFCADHWRKLSPGFRLRIQRDMATGNGSALTTMLADARRWLAAREAA
jgi:hypothetical protein